MTSVAEFGVIAYLVAQLSHEIGIRMALGDSAPGMTNRLDALDATDAVAYDYRSTREAK